MTSKERILAAIAHEEPDRVPTGEWEFGREIVEPVLGPGTYRHEWATKLALWQGRRDAVIHAWKTGLVALTHHYGWDAVLVHLCLGRDTPIETPESLGNNRFRTRRGDIVTYSPETDAFLYTERAPAPGPPPPPPPPEEAAARQPTDSELEVLRHAVREIGRTHFLFSAGLWGHPGLHYADATRSEVENWVAVYEDPDAACERRLQQVRTPATRLGIETARREGMDGVATGCDYGCNTGPFLSPEMFRRAVFPGLQAWCRLVHEHGLVTLLHSCGNNRVLMDQIVEAGVDIYQSIQPEMDIAALKQRYGKHLTLWGGVPAGALVSESPSDVRALARPVLEACKPGGGFIYATSHSVMPGAKPDNYRAMLDVLREFGGYLPR